MPDLSFHVESAEPQRGTLAPQLLFRIGVIEPTQTPIHTVVLRCQVHIEPARRRYNTGEEKRLLDLFGTPDRWGQTLRHLQWVQVNAVVPPFVGSTLVEVSVPCSYDFCLASVRYFDALSEGDVALCFLFNGTIFYDTPGEGLQVAQIAWEKEAGFKLPISTWKQLMQRHYLDSVWLRLRKDLFDRLSRLRSRRGLPTEEHALEHLLAAEETIAL